MTQFVGIDIAKSKHEVSIIDEQGKPVCRSFSFANSIEGANKLLDIFKQKAVAPDNSVIGMEATGHYWLSVFSFLSDLGFSVNVINPIQSDSFRKMYIRQTKTDAKDAFYIAQIMRIGQYSSTVLADELLVALKQLSRYRLFLVDECSDCKRKVISLLDQVFPEYASVFSDTFGVTSKEILLQCPTPEDMLAISTEDLTAVLNKSSRGRFNQSKSEALKEIASKSFGVKFAKDAFAFQIRQLIEQINFIEKQISDLETEISSLLDKANTYITSITGIGEVLGAVILSEIGDISRFSEAPKLVAFAGLDVTVKQSGEFLGTHNRISKRGSPYLRRAIWIAASIAAFKDPALSVYYQSLRQRGKHHLAAVGAVARKMCNIIFAVLRDNKPYQPNI